MINDRHLEARTVGSTKRAILPFSNPLAGTSETDTGWDLPDSCIVTDVIIEVTTNVGGSTIEVGLLVTDPNGFADAVSCATATLVRPEAAITIGGTETYYSANTRGAYLIEGYLAGTNTVEDTGIYCEKPYMSPSGGTKSVSYTTSAHAVAGNIHVFYIDLA